MTSFITGIEETLDSGVEICAGDDHELGGVWRVPDDGRVHGGVRVRRGWRAVGAVSRTSFVFPGWCSGERCRRGRWDFRDWRGRSRVFALVDLSRRRGGVVAIQRRRRGVDVGGQRVRVSLRAHDDYFKQL